MNVLLKNIFSNSYPICNFINLQRKTQIPVASYKYIRRIMMFFQLLVFFFYFCLPQFQIVCYLDTFEEWHQNFRTVF